jgi:hypothetical protein
VRKSQDERFSIVTAIKVSDETSETTRETRVLQLIFALGVEELMGAVVIGFGHKNFGRAIQVAVVGRGGIDEFLRGDDAVFLEHDHEHLGVHDGAGVEKLHAGKLTTAGRAEASEGGMNTDTHGFRMSKELGVNTAPPQAPRH